MNKIKSTIAISTIALMAACTSTPEYHAAPHMNESGYSETQIETNRYRVSFKLNRDDVADAQEMALRRAAELTLEKGFDTFELVSQSTDSQTERASRTYASASSDTVIQRNCGLLACSTSVSRVPSTEIGADLARDESEVVVTLEIILSDKDASVSPSLYDASEVFASLSA